MGDMADLIDFWFPDEDEDWNYEEDALLRNQDKLFRAKLEFMEADIRELKKRLGEAEEEW